MARAAGNHTARRECGEEITVATLFEIEWRMSDEARKAHFVATGTKADQKHIVRFDAETMAPADRATLYELTGESLRDGIWGDRATEPTLADVLAHAAQRTAKKRADAIGRAAGKLQADCECLLRNILEHDPALPAYCYDAIDADQADRLGLDTQPWREMRATIQANQAAWQAEAAERARQKELLEAVQKAAADRQAEADRQAKIAWAAQHGSAHLQRALAAGHDCGRLYWIERAGVEYPGYILDYEKHLTTRSRSCPSITALDEHDAVLAAHPEATVEIEWITAPANDRKADEWVEFEECEGIVVDDPIYRHRIVKLF
jgi:hypothetical protein